MIGTLNIIKFLLVMFIVYCDSVSIDYYAADKNEDEDQYTNLSTLHTFGDNPNLQATIVNATNTFENRTSQYNDSQYGEEDNIDNIEVIIENEKLFINESAIKTSVRSSKQFKHNILALSESDIIFDISDVELPNIYSDYEYVYDNGNTTLFHSLRQENFNRLGDNYNNTELDTLDAIDDNDENNSMRYMVDFYNLQPAAVILNHDDSFNIVTVANNSVWYVPEKYSCWELPILYGEFGMRESTAEVFLIYLSSLKNVVDIEEDVTPRSRPLIVPVAQSLNKWCAVAPCYGDHTLCIFSEKLNSKLCQNNYKVIIPSTIEQIGLVNTVNSMRNRIANGETDIYDHLPTAADMKQIIYDFDLERMAEAWLHQCLPGPASCSALDGNYVAQLECTKYAEHCCITSYKNDKASKCIPQYECFIDPIIGCIHAWFWSAGKQLTTTDVQCGHLTAATFNTVQLLWADTNKIGCAYGENPNGDVRVVCNFAPGAPFYIDTKYYCGFIAHKDISSTIQKGKNITDKKFLSSFGINMVPMKSVNTSETKPSSHHVNYTLRFSEIDILSKIYKRKWVRQQVGEYSNGTIALLARLVTKYTFSEDSGSRCDLDEPVYRSGNPGSLCVERGRRFHALCYDFRDPTPGYRLVAVLAPVALFSLILYHLFSGVVRQTDY